MQIRLFESAVYDSTSRKIAQVVNGASKYQYGFFKNSSVFDAIAAAYAKTNNHQYTVILIDI